MMIVQSRCPTIFFSTLWRALVSQLDRLPTCVVATRVFLNFNLGLDNWFRDTHSRNVAVGAPTPVLAVNDRACTHFRHARCGTFPRWRGSRCPGEGIAMTIARRAESAADDKIHRLMHGRGAVIRAPGITSEHALTVTLSRARGI